MRSGRQQQQMEIGRRVGWMFCVDCLGAATPRPQLLVAFVSQFADAIPKSIPDFGAAVNPGFKAASMSLVAYEEIQVAMIHAVATITALREAASASAHLSAAKASPALSGLAGRGHWPKLNKLAGGCDATVAALERLVEGIAQIGVDRGQRPQVARPLGDSSRLGYAPAALELADGVATLRLASAARGFSWGYDLVIKKLFPLFQAFLEPDEDGR